MKFLIDAQLPRSLSSYFDQHGFDSLHTSDLPSGNRSTDRDIIETALAQDRVVVTKDSDFLESHLIDEKPEKLLMVRTGNIPNMRLLKLFKDHHETIIEMLNRSNLVELSSEAITEY